MRIPFGQVFETKASLAFVKNPLCGFNGHNANEKRIMGAFSANIPHTRRPSMRETEFERKVARALGKAKIPFQSHVALDGVQPDFVIKTPDGRVIVVEAKAWEHSPGFAAHAEEQAEYFRNLAGADVAFIVVKSLERSRRAAGVVTVDDLVGALQEEFEKGKGKPTKETPVLKPAKKTVFAAMPFAREYEDTFFVAMAPSADSIGAVCRRVDQEEYVGDVVQQMEIMIRSATAVVADLSEAKPNVFYEAGFARGIGKPTIAICSTPVKDLPFDVNHWNIIKYGRGQTHLLKGKLSRRLKSIVS